MNENKYFKIRKEFIYIFVAFCTCCLLFVTYDYFTHLNWPPHLGRNKELIKKLNCDYMKYNLTKNNLPEIPFTGGSGGYLDRNFFIDNPSCASSLYLYDEGTGIRREYHIYDMRTKKMSAVINFTFYNSPESLGK